MDIALVFLQQHFLQGVAIPERTFQSERTIMKGRVAVIFEIAV